MQAFRYTHTLGTGWNDASELMPLLTVALRVAEGFESARAAKALKECSIHHRTGVEAWVDFLAL